MRVAAFQNGYFIALCNRVGTEECLTFGGESFVCAPDGTVVARAPRLQDSILMANVDLDQVRSSHADESSCSTADRSSTHSGSEPHEPLVARLVADCCCDGGDRLFRNQVTDEFVRDARRGPAGWRCRERLDPRGAAGRRARHARRACSGHTATMGPVRVSARRGSGRFVRCCTRTRFRLIASAARCPRGSNGGRGCFEV